MDSSSELVHSLLPLFMASSLGASVAVIGIVEGAAEATAAITKIFSGTLSDSLGHRKRLVALGYGLAALTKPVFPLAGSMTAVFAARFVDRIGKGIRGAPRDALVADITPANLRGAAYGLRQSLDSIGAVIGPLLALTFMAVWAGNIQAVLWVAVVPAFLSVALVVLAVREPRRDSPLTESGRVAAPLAGHAWRSALRRLPLAYWLVVGFGAVFTLARFSEAFLVLRARDVGIESAHVPIVMVLMNVAYAATSYPAGTAADRFSARALLALGLGMLIVADIVLALAASAMAACVGSLLWGVHMGLTQGMFAKLVADTVPAELRGTGFGVFNFVSGIALLLASVIAGALWSQFGAAATFWAGAAFAAIAAIGSWRSFGDRE